MSVVLALGLGLAALAPVPARAQAGAAQRAAARQFLDDGKRLYQAQKYEEAAEKFRQAYELDPSQTTALYNQAFALRKAGKLAEAKAIYLTFLRVKPDDNDGLFGLAETERQLGEQAAALRLFTEYLTREKRPEKARYVEYARTKVDELRAVAEGRAPTPPSARQAADDDFEKGNEAYRAGRFPEAAAAYHRVWQADRGRSDAMYREALALRKAEDYEAAIRVYEEFRKKDPAELDGLFGLAETLRLAGRNDEAKKLFADYARLEKRSSRAKYLAYAKKQLEELEKATTPPAAIAAGPASPANAADGKKRFDAGMDLYKQGKFAEAAEAFQKAHQKDPGLHQALYREGLARRKTGDLEGARKAYEAFTAAQPDDPDGHYGLAETHRLRGDVPAARRSFERYVALEKRPSEQKYVEKARAYLEETKGQGEAVAAAEGAEAGAEGEGATGEASEASAAAAEPAAAGERPGAPAAVATGAPRAVKAAPGVEPAEGHAHLGASAAEHAPALAERVTVAGLLHHGEDALAKGDAATAARHFALAIALDPDDPAPYLLHGKALEEAGRDGDAAKRYQEALRRAESGPVADEAERRLAALQGGPVKATGRRRPGGSARQQREAAGLLDEARGLVSAQDYAEALARLGEAANLDPGNPDIFLATGDLHLATKQSVRALQAYQRALALAPDRAAPLYGIARAYEAAGERRVAEHHYRLYARSKASDVDPKLQRDAWLRAEGATWPLGS